MAADYLVLNSEQIQLTQFCGDNDKWIVVVMVRCLFLQITAFLLPYFDADS